MSDNLLKLLQPPAAKSQSAFIIRPDETVVSYAEALAAARRIANALAARGVKPGDRVAAQTEKSPEAIFLYLACLATGAVYLPLNMAYTAGEFEYFMGDAKPALVVLAPERAEAYGRIARAAGAGAVETLGAKGDGSLMDLAAKQADDFKTMRRKKSDLAALLYTSGTTGRSKGAMITHDNLASNARVLVKTWHFTSDDVLLHALPIFHTHGLFVATNVVMTCGASMIFLAKFAPDEIFRHLRRATAMMGVPTFYTRLLDDKRLDKKSTKHMRLFVSGSAPLLADTHRSWGERTGHAILERYGMTETGMITSNPYSGSRVPGAVGPPLEDVAVRIANPETGALLQSGEVGMIEVKGPNVFKGYWEMPEKTKAEFRRDGYFITGDLGLIDDKGYVHIVGRGKDLVISGGYNVYPKEVEAEIDALPGVIETAVIGLAHPDFGEGVTAIVARAKHAKIDEKSVLAALDGRLAKYKLPKRVLFVDDLPRNAMGKVMKAELRETHKGLYKKA